ncbi:MAG: hypothetical protein QOJ52_1805 [Acidimicrobiaceae bacterium]|nr:hypothetical protein [Acidimicrobiaceae bacterium]
MFFGLLGPLEVSSAGGPVVIAGPRRRVLLARLLIDTNRVVSTERLIEDIWNDDPPEHPANALQAYISHLRAVLEPDRAGQCRVVVTLRPGYLLATEPGNLDTATFGRLAAEGRTCLGRGRAADAVATLSEALRLWRGPPLAEFADEAWARPEIARLVALRWGAVEDRLQAELDLGRHTSVVDEAEAAAVEQPLRERLWAMRVLALYRCGRQAEALRAYSELRTFLGEELGIEPSPELARLEEAILLQKPDLEWQRDAKPPSFHRATSVRRAPPLLVQSGQLPLVGRRPELDCLRQAWAAVREARRAVLLAGEPGVGKTRLASEIAAHAFSEGALVLAGRCDEGMGVPYQPFVEALRHFVDDSADHDLMSGLGPSAGELTRVLPELVQRLPQLAPPLSSDPDTERYRLFVAMACWLSAASAVSPVLLVIDDLHWATKPTFLLLRHILRSTDAMRLLVVATYRDTELSQDRAVAQQMTALAQGPEVIGVHLDGMSEMEVAELVAAAGGAHSPGWAHAIHVATRGNPFFVGEVVRHLIETGTLSDGSGVTGPEGGGLGIPAGVRAVVADRLGRVSPTTHEVLSVAAVAGLEFELPVLRTAAGCSGDAVTAVMDEAHKARLVEDTPGPGMRYRFVHGLVQATIYGEMSRARRVHLHRRVGEAIEALHGGRIGEHLPELARHFGEAAVDGDIDKAVTYTQGAGDVALAQLAHDEAAHYYQQALGMLDDPGPSDEAARRQRAELVVLLGEAQRRAGRPAYRATLFEGATLAAALGDTALLTRAALANNRGFFSLVGAVDAERVKVIEQALAADGPDDSSDRARLMAQLATELIFAGDWDTRVALSDQALASARSLRDPGTIVHVLNLRYATLWAAPTLAERLEVTAEARDLAAVLADPVPRFYASLFGSHAAMEAGDLPAAAILFAEAQKAANGLGQATIDWFAAVTAAKLALATAPLAEAERLILHALTIGHDAGQPDALAWAAVQLSAVRRHQGRSSELVAPTEALLTQPFTGSVAMLARASLAASNSEVGRVDEAKSLLEALSDEIDSIPCDFGWLATAALVAQVSWKVGGCSRPDAIYDLLVPYRDNFVDVGPGWLGSVAHYVGLIAAVLGRTEEADDAFAQAADAHTRLGAHTWLAVTQAAWAELLAGSTSPKRIRQRHMLLSDAHTAARRLGMADLERQTSICLAELRDRQRGS